MLFGFILLFGYALIVWLVFFRFKWLKFSIPWGVVSALVGAHLLIIFMLGLRYMTPASADARIIQHTIQLTPRLSEPTLVTEVLVAPNTHVKKGAPLFRFDTRIYAAKVRQLEAQLAAARQDVGILAAETQVTREKVVRLRADLRYSQSQAKMSVDLASTGAGPEEDAQKWTARVASDEAAIAEAIAEQKVSELKYQSNIGGVNTSVAQTQAELDQARYYLANTEMVAPEDGTVINLQVRPGMIAGDYRIGAIATFVADDGRYLLANYFQENLKYMKPGQDAEIALDLYPGQIWKGKVKAIWQGSGAGQMLPSGVLPDFSAKPPQVPQGMFAVAITLDDPDQSKFPIGTQGRAAVYARPHSGFVVLRKIAIRSYTWFNWLYPFNV